MRKKIKVWITSDPGGTYIWQLKPELKDGYYQYNSGDCFKVDNSKHLYKEPTEVYFCIEQPKKKKKVKPWCYIRENIENYSVKKLSSLKQLAKRFPKYHNFRPVKDFKFTFEGWKYTYGIMATTNNKEQRDDIIAFVNNLSLFEK